MRLWPRRRSARILALVAFRDEMRFLPDWLENVRPQVDGIVALDDGSTDGSAELVAGQSGVLELIRGPAAEPHVWNDAMNHRRLVEAAWRHHPDWLLAIDADERLEIDFRERAEREMARAQRQGHRAYRVRVREIWDDPSQYRADGIWGAKSAARFFEARRDHQFHMQRLHCHWAPLNSMENGDFPPADLELYHLRMLTARDRRARRARYETLDPGREQQTIGYAYLTDPTGLRLERIPADRRYQPLPRVLPPSAPWPMPVIVGAPRSGTTLLRFMLDAHPQLAIPPETAFLRLGPDLVARRADANEFRRALVGFPETAPAWGDFGIAEQDFREALERLTPFTVADGFRAFYRLYAARYRKERWGDKTPLYCKAIAPIRELLPEARFVHLIRDGRDAALSLRRTWFSPGHEIETQATYWRDCVAAARAAGRRHADYLEVRYEALVERPAAVLERICGFIELDFDEAMLDYHRRAPQRLAEHQTRRRADGTPLVTHDQRVEQVKLTTAPPDPARAYAWKQEMSAAEQRRFSAVAGDLLAELGYER